MAPSLPPSLPLPPAPHQGTAESFADVEALLGPLGTTRKVSPSIYALQVRVQEWGPTV